MCMVKLQGSDATCSTTRRTELLPTDATNCAAPALLADDVRIQAMPSTLGTVLDTDAPPTERLKFTGVGCSIRLWKSSKTKAMPVMASGRATGTREGRARKLSC